MTLTLFPWLRAARPAAESLALPPTSASVLGQPQKMTAHNALPEAAT